MDIDDLFGPVTKPAAAAAAATASRPPASNMSDPFDPFGPFPSSPPAATAPTAAPAGQQQRSNQVDDPFGDFAAPVAATATPALAAPPAADGPLAMQPHHEPVSTRPDPVGDDGFGDFATAQQVQVQPLHGASPPATHEATADAFFGGFSAPSASAVAASTTPATADQVESLFIAAVSAVNAEQQAEENDGFGDFSSPSQVATPVVPAAVPHNCPAVPAQQQHAAAESDVSEDHQTPAREEHPVADPFGDFSSPAAQDHTQQQQQQQHHDEEHRAVDSDDWDTAAAAPAPHFADPVVRASGTNDAPAAQPVDDGFDDFAAPPPSQPQLPSNAAHAAVEQQPMMTAAAPVDDDGFGDFAEAQTSGGGNAASQDADDGFGAFEQPTPLAPQPPPPHPQASSASWMPSERHSSEPQLVSHAYTVVPTASDRTGAALTTALDEVALCFGIPPRGGASEAATRFLLHDAALITSPGSASATREFKISAAATATFVEPSSFRTVVAARIASVVAATHRAALVGTAADAAEHERRSAGRLLNVLPVFGHAARGLDMEAFLRNVCCF